MNDIETLVLVLRTLKLGRPKKDDDVLIKRKNKTYLEEANYGSYHDEAFSFSNGIKIEDNDIEYWAPNEITFK